MGYAGYVPAKYAAKATPEQQALWQVRSMESLETIGKLIRNVVINPTEEKYRKIRLTNARINAVVVQSAGALDALLAMGWAYEDAESKETLVVPKGVKLSMAEVRAIEEAKDRLKKENRLTVRARDAAKLPADEAQERIRAQMEADRRERAAAEPVTQASVAQALSAGNGLRLATGKDVGMHDDC